MTNLPMGAEIKACSVRDAGARGDGVSDDSPAIQRALDGIAGVVTIPEGVYRLGETLRVPSGRTILTHPRAVMRMADGAGRHARSFLLTNADYRGGNDHIAVHGGIWDGNCEGNPRSPDGHPAPYTGIAISFTNVRHLRLTDLTVKNPESYSIRLIRTKHFLVENVVFDQSIRRYNQDGVHLSGFCEDGHIRNLVGATQRATNDDMVALNADDLELPMNFGEEEFQGPIRNIHIDGLKAECPLEFVRILSRTQLIENVTIRNISGGCIWHAICIHNGPFPVGSGNIRNVDIRDVDIVKSDVAGYRPHALLTVNLDVRNLTVERFRRVPDDAPVTAPTLAIENNRFNSLEMLDSGQDLAGRLSVESTEGEVAPLPMPDGKACRASLRMRPGGRLLLASGSIDRLTMNPES